MNALLLLKASCALLILTAPVTLHAQYAIGVRYGQGEGTANYNLGEVNARVHVTGPFYLTSAFQMIGGAWDCLESSADALRCGYDGNTVSLVAAVAAVDSRRAFIALNGGLGGFFRKDGDPNADNRHLTGNVGIDGEVTVWGPLRIQVAVAHRRIFDADYRSAFGDTPNFTSMTGGLSFVFGSRD